MKFLKTLLIAGCAFAALSFTCSQAEAFGGVSVDVRGGRVFHSHVRVGNPYLYHGQHRTSSYYRQYPTYNYDWRSQAQYDRRAWGSQIYVRPQRGPAVSVWTH